MDVHLLGAVGARHPEVVVGERVLPRVVAHHAEAHRNHVVCRETRVLAAVLTHRALDAQHGELLRGATERTLPGGERDPHAVTDRQAVDTRADRVDDAGAILIGNELAA